MVVVYLWQVVKKPSSSTDSKEKNFKVDEKQSFNLVKIMKKEINQSNNEKSPNFRRKK